jgi:hypothetical protein
VVELFSFINSALEGGDWSASRPGRLTPEKNPALHRVGGQVGPRGRGQVGPRDRGRFLT